MRASRPMEDMWRSSPGWRLRGGLPARHNWVEARQITRAKSVAGGGVLLLRHIARNIGELCFFVLMLIPSALARARQSRNQQRLPTIIAKDKKLTILLRHYCRK